MIDAKTTHEMAVLVLTRARALVADPGHWTKRAYARNATGDDVDPLDKDATAFCMFGAMCRAAGMSSGSTMLDLFEIPGLRELERVAQIAGGAGASDITRFNDFVATHKDVLAAFDVAIEQETFAQRG